MFRGEGPEEEVEGAGVAVEVTLDSLFSGAGSEVGTGSDGTARRSAVSSAFQSEGRIWFPLRGVIPRNTR